jgi:hypothetical protein
VAKVCCWLGLQDAARKRREPSQKPGVWAGLVVSTDGDNVYKEVTQECWDKAKKRINWFAHYAGLELELAEGLFDDEQVYEIGKPKKGWMNYKLAEKYRGFLVYVPRTYTAMVPYRKGIHLSLESWRPVRDEDGWRISNGIESKIEYETDAPKPVEVMLASRFRDDMKALLHLFQSPIPMRNLVRPTETATVYMVGDASGMGFGPSTWVEGKGEIDAAHGMLNSISWHENSKVVSK